MWPLLAIAIGQTFVLILGGIDLSVGATMGFTSVVGAVVMAQTLDPAFFDKSPLWGTLMRPERRHPGRQRSRGPHRRARHAAGGGTGSAS